MSVVKTPAELYALSEHVEYEIFQLNDCMRRLALDWLDERDTTLYNSLITAFTIYARNIYLFLYAENPRDDDIVAARYFDDPAFWKTNRAKATPLLVETNDEANKRSAHLTERRNEQRYYWKWVYIHDDLRAVLRTFVANVQTDKVRPGLLHFEQHWTWRDQLQEPAG